MSQPSMILVRPQMGENIGAAARAMLNFGLTDMRLVAPRDGWPNPEAGPAASGADAVLERAQVFDTVNDALADNPGLVNDDPLGAAWFFKMKVDEMSQLDSFMSEDEYNDMIA